MWGWRRVTVPPPSAPESAPQSGIISVTFPSDQTQRGSELTSPMLEPQEMADQSKRELIRKVMGQAKDKHSKVFIERIPRNIVIAFVEKLEKTHQRLDVREYLRRNCDSIKYDSDAKLIVERILGGQEGKHRFDGYYKEVIHRSVQEHITLLNLDKELNGNLPGRQYSECNDMSKVGKLFKPSCPVSELVFRTRREDFVMNMNPEVELEKIKTSEPYFYSMEFVTRPPPRDYISVKDLKIDNKPVIITSRNEVEVVYLSQPVDVRVGSSAEPAKEKAEGDVERMLHVLNRYWFCCQRFRKTNLLALNSAVDDTTQK